MAAAVPRTRRRRLLRRRLGDHQRVRHSGGRADDGNLRRHLYGYAGHGIHRRHQSIDDVGRGGSVMVTTAQAVGVLFPPAVPLVDFIVSDNVITYWNNAIGTQPSSAALAAFTQAQADAATRNAAIIQLRPNNLLVNGGFDVVQRATGSVANTAYGFDRWKVFAQSDVISCGQVATTPEPASSVNTISLATVTTQRFG